MIAAVCWSCVCSLHDECFDITEDDEGVTMCCCAHNPEPEARGFGLVGRPVKDPADIDDITSTGRKRAAMLYPILTDMECSWAWLKHAGGGVEPIVGCAGNRIDPVKTGPRAGHRHHGPDKNTISNGPLNVHLICTTCHNRYHALNNQYYPATRPPADQQWLPVAPDGKIVKQHDMYTLATDEEREDNEQWWATSKADRYVVTDD